MVHKPQTLDGAEIGEVKLHNAALAEQGDDVICRGVLDIDSLGFLRVDDYQRETLAPSGGKRPLLNAIDKGVTFPDVELGMRGQDISFHGGVAILRDPVFIVDGLQRISALREYIHRYPDKPLKSFIGATVHFGTDKKKEAQRFEALNANRIPVAASVHLRNMRADNPGILTLYGLSINDPTFALYKRVTWNQRMARGELITGLSFGRVAYSLHRHFRGSSKGHGGAIGSKLLPDGLARVVSNVGLRALRDNLKEFFEVIDHCWGLRNVEYSTLAIQTKSNWLMTCANVMSDHTNFWHEGDEKHLHVDADMKRKLASFPLDENNVARLAASGNMALPILYHLLKTHLNKGKRVNKLVERKESVVRDIADDEAA